MRKNTRFYLKSKYIVEGSGEIVLHSIHNSDDIAPDVLATVDRHEIGHSLGLDHVNDPSDLMNDELIGRNTLIDRMSERNYYDETQN